MIRSADAVVVGAGLAGAASAYELARRGLTVVLLEQEDFPGRHASGRNAGVARRLIASPDQLPLAIEGIRFMEQPPEDFPAGAYFRRTGSLLLAAEEHEASLRASLEAGRSAGVDGEWLTAAEVERQVPATAGGRFVGAAHGRDDGLADAAALLQALLRAGRGHGLQVWSDCRLLGVETEGGGVSGVRTSAGNVATPCLVNAAGAWAKEVAALAGAAPLALRTLRRHLMVSCALPWVDRSWPAVWDLTHEVYFRPEPPGLLLSPCDATDASPDGEQVDPRALELLAEKLTRWLPRLGGISIAKVWAGLRTFSTDGNLLLGADPQLAGFFWCAALGGNGVTLSPAVGRIVAEAVLGQVPPAAHDARRFAAA